MTATGTGDIRVLVIDDSAYNRQTLTSILAAVPGLSVVGRAGDGDEGLRLAFEHHPDVITLDLEMPKMDGFTFLRILMSRRPTPVIVISSHAKQENVFKALELGALDFIAKPGKAISPELRNIGGELVEKIRLCGRLQRVSLARPAVPTAPVRAETAPMISSEDDDTLVDAHDPLSRLRRGRRRKTTLTSGPFRLVCIGASTGGPPALKHVFSVLPRDLPIAIVVSQHMPPTFTGTFASRLDRASAFEVREAHSGEHLRAGLALVAPGSGSLVVSRDGRDLRVDVEAPRGRPGTRGAPRFIPSVDRMLQSAAAAAGPDVLAVVLTGMGDDGSAGVAAVRAEGGRVIAESEETAVIFGMPEAAIRTGFVDEVVPLDGIPAAIARFAGEPARARD